MTTTQRVDATPTTLTELAEPGPLSTPATISAPEPHELNRRWTAAFNAGDLDQIMTMYEPDAVLVPFPGADPVQGHPAIRAALAQLLALGAQGRFTPHFWLTSGDLVLGSVTFEMDGGSDADGNPVAFAGVTIEVVRRQADGTWAYVIDHPFGGGAS